MTAYAFYYRVAAQFAVYNNAFILPVFDGGKLTALYPINASRVDLVEYMGQMYARLTFATGSVYTVPYEQIIHLRRHYLDNDIFGDNNTPLTPTLETADSFNKSMSKFAKLVSVIRGIYDVSAVDIPAYEETSLSARSFFEVEHSKEVKVLEQAARRRRLLARTRTYSHTDE